jgi:hypothetical protein
MSELSVRLWSLADISGGRLKSPATRRPKTVCKAVFSASLIS